MSEKTAKSGASKSEPASLHEIPFEETVGDPLKVKKPGQRDKPKKPKSRERTKRSI